MLNYTLIKRGLGIGIIFAFLFIEPQMVLYGYIVSTFIGYVLNVHLLSKVSEIGVKRQLLLFGEVLLPSLIYYGFMLFVSKYVDSQMIQLIIGGGLLIIYYFLIMKLYNIDVIDYLGRFLKTSRKK